MQQPRDRAGRSGRVRHRPDRTVRLLRRHSRTWLCGDGRPSDAQIDLYRRAREQIAYNLELVRPGVGLREFSDKALPLPERFLRQSLFRDRARLGVCDEYPAVYYPEDVEITGYDGVLEAGMTDLGRELYRRGGRRQGVELEEQVLITVSGAEVLSRYPFEDAVFG